MKRNKQSHHTSPNPVPKPEPVVPPPPGEESPPVTHAYESGLTESSKLYQAALEMKLKIWTLFFAVSAGLATFFWASKNYTENKAGQDQLIAIRLFGSFSCILCIAAICRVQQLVDHHEMKVAEYSRELGLPKLADRDRVDLEPEDKFVPNSVRRVGW